MNAGRSHWNRLRTKSRHRLLLETLEQRALMHGGDWLVADEPSAEFTDADGSAFYIPPQHRLTNPTGLLSGPGAGDAVTVATQFLVNHAEELRLNTTDVSRFIVTDEYADESSGITHLYLRQTWNDREVINADLGVHLTSAGEVINVSSSFVADPQEASPYGPQYVMNAPQAYAAFSDEVGLELLSEPQVRDDDSVPQGDSVLMSVTGAPWADIPAKLVYLPTESGLQLAWRFDLHTPDYSHWVDAFVDADTGRSLYLDDRIDNATYNVFAWPSVSPINGSRSLAVDPQDGSASPYGWHDTNGVIGPDYTDTRGNNVTAQEDVNGDNLGGTRPSGGAGLTFSFPYDPAKDPALYQSAAITNVFYWINWLHDVHYQYGFTEAAGNFQVNNYGRGGAGNDPVIVDVQDGDGGTNGFAALPDGQSPRMSLYRRTNPYRDAAYDSEVIVHEFGHGISERLTGGPSNVSALNATQSKAMGEGWGDFYALALLQTPSDGKFESYGIGNYAAGYPASGPGIRQYPYSFDKSVDPLTYGAYNGDPANRESHKAGAIWCSALWDLNWLLIDKHGFSADVMHGTGGNNLTLQLVMDGMKLQGTNPSFLAGRDAILAADRVRTGGQNQAEIWAAFARRGMGFSASDGGGAGATSIVEAFDVPSTISGTVYRDDDADGLQSGSEAGLAGWQVYLDKNNNGIVDGATTVVFNSTDTPKPIADRGITYSNLAVAGLGGVITDLDVTVNLTHPYDGELYVTLISPANTPVILANYLGGSGDNYSNTTFDDEATTYVAAGAAPFSGSFKPFFNLSQLDGRDPNGTWKLRVDDAVLGNVGQLLNWSLRVTYGSPDPTAVTDANGHYTFFGVGDGAYHVRELAQPGFSTTSPVSGVNDVTIAGGVSASNADFGNRAAATVANAQTLEDTLSGPITITPTVGQGITHFKISGVSGGTLYKNDGVSSINNGTFVSTADGLAGVRFLPAPNSTLAGRFDVELSADGLTVLSNTSKSFSVITVTPVNDAPTISDIPNLAIDEGTPTAALPFVIADVETAADSLALIANSSNTALVPNGNIVLGGSGANRSVIVTPAARQSGTVTITLQVSDGELSSTDTFTIEVNAAAQAPVITSLTSPSALCAVSLTSPTSIAGTFLDLDSATHTVLVDWGDGSSSPAVVDQVKKSFAANHSYSQPGVASGASSYIVTATISDGGLTDSKEVAVRTTGAFLNNGVLEVLGTAIRDTVVLRKLTSEQLVVEFYPVPTNKSLVFSYRFPLADVTTVRMEMCGGNDAVTIQALAALPVSVDGGDGADTLVSGDGPAILLGGEGSDMLRAGPGGAVLVGGSGTDYLYGGQGRDVLIGGKATDYVVGQSTDDILIGGTTSYDIDLPALSAIHSKWREPIALPQRIAALDAGIVEGTRTVRIKKTVTVFDDGVIDSIFGSPSSNWRLDT